MAYKFCWPTLIQPSDLWRILLRVMAGTLKIIGFIGYLLVELMHECTIIVATSVLFVAHK